jgi:hypothetical protein
VESPGPTQVFEHEGPLPILDRENACGCDAAGMPCSSCNVSNPDNPPQLPAGFQRDESFDDE